MVDVSWQALIETAQKAWGRVSEGIASEDWLSPEGLRSAVRLVRPIEPFNRPDFLAPIVGIAGALLGLLLLGVAVTSMASLLVALLALGLMLARVYGVSLEIG